jgi:cytochrome c oxidase subunit II
VPNTQDAYGDVEGVFLPVAVGVFVVVAGAIVVLALRGRRRTIPGRRANNLPLELAILAVLVITAAILVTVSFSSEDRIGSAAASPALRIRVVAAKWRWRFEYPAQRIAIQGVEGRVPTLVVPAGREVEIEGVSLDVIHAFWVPELRFQRQLFPDRPTRFALVFPHPGFLSSGRCSFYCGLRHQDMRFGVEVMTPAGFRAWAQRA